MLDGVLKKEIRLLDLGNQFVSLRKRHKIAQVYVMSKEANHPIKHKIAKNEHLISDVRHSS